MSKTENVVLEVILLTLLSCYKLNRCYIKLSLVNILENVFMFIEILFKMLLFKGGVLIYAEHCIYIINNIIICHSHMTLQPKTDCPLKLCRVEPGQYLDGRPPGKTRLLLEEALVRPAECVGPNTPV